MAPNSNYVANLELEDYIAIKEKAYEFFVKNNNTDNFGAKYINEYVTNVLDFELDEPEAIVFVSTVLVPYDQDVCRLYHSGEEAYNNFKKQNLIYGKHIDLKTVEIEKFGLDRLISEKVLTPPQYADYIVSKNRKQ